MESRLYPRFGGILYEYSTQGEDGIEYGKAAAQRDAELGDDTRKLRTGHQEVAGSVDPHETVGAYGDVQHGQAEEAEDVGPSPAADVQSIDEGDDGNMFSPADGESGPDRGRVDEENGDQLVGARDRGVEDVA